MLFVSNIHIMLPISRIRKFFLHPSIFVIVFLLSISIPIFSYRSQPRHELSEPITQQRREDLEDIVRIATLTSLFYGVWSWLITAEATRKKASLDAIDNFRKEYIVYCKKRKEFGIERHTNYQAFLETCKKNEHGHIWEKKNDHLLDDAEEIFNSILGSCEELCIAMDHGIIDENLVKSCLIGAFLSIGEWLCDYIKEKQNEHPGRWINFLETISRWHQQKPKIDLQAMIEKNRSEEIINFLQEKHRA